MRNPLEECAQEVKEQRQQIKDIKQKDEIANRHDEIIMFLAFILFAIISGWY